MAKASRSLSAAETASKAAIAAAAAEIHALINSRAQSPTEEELAAILTPHMNAASPKGGTPKRQLEWDALMAELRAAEAKVDAGEVAASAERQATAARLVECAGRIIDEAPPTRTQAETLLLASALCWLGLGFDVGTPTKK